MQTIRTDDAVLHVSDTGPRDGRAVLFGNSLGTDLRVWDAMLPHLPEDLRLIRWDKRGHGLSDVGDSRFDIDLLVRDAAAVVDAAGVRSVTVVGLSIGGLIGLGLALARPDLVKGLVLMDTAARIGTPQLWDDRIVALERDGLEAMADGVMDRWFSAAMRSDAGRVAPWRNGLSRTAPEGYIGCCRAIGGADFTDRLPDISCPVIATAGAEDKATPPDLVRATADALGAPFHLIEGAGHLPCVERPEETAALITRFLEETA